MRTIIRIHNKNSGKKAPLLGGKTESELNLLYWMMLIYDSDSIKSFVFKVLFGLLNIFYIFFLTVEENQHELIYQQHTGSRHCMLHMHNLTKN